jgi:ribosomal protein S18 acetylase RimI-like enzyme
MTIGDYAAVFALWQAAEGLILSDADSEPAVAQYLTRNPGISQVACEDERIVGAALCGHDGRRGFLHHLAVAPPFRDRGIGRAIVDVCRAKLMQAGIDRCNIFVLSDFDRGKRFWKRYGFVEWPNIQLMSMEWDSNSNIAAR